MSITPPVAELERVSVHTPRLGQACPGVRAGRVAAYAFRVPERLRIRPDASRQQRAYLLLEQSIQLYQPAWFLDHPGWWYVDLVDINEHGNTIHLTDRYVDIIVGPPTHPYRVIDLEELGDAITTGRLGPADAAHVLAATQAFLDRHLNRRHDLALEWPDFPPGALATVRDVKIPC